MYSALRVSFWSGKIYERSSNPSPQFPLISLSLSNPMLGEVHKPSVHEEREKVPALLRNPNSILLPLLFFYEGVWKKKAIFSLCKFPPEWRQVRRLVFFFLWAIDLRLFIFLDDFFSCLVKEEWRERRLTEESEHTQAIV